MGRVFQHIIILIKKYSFCLVYNTVSVLFASIGLNLKVTWPLQPYFLRLLICLEEIEKTVRKRRPSQYSVNKKFCFANLGVMNSALEIIYSVMTGTSDKGRHMLGKQDRNFNILSKDIDHTCILWKSWLLVDFQQVDRP